MIEFLFLCLVIGVIAWIANGIREDDQPRTRKRRHKPPPKSRYIPPNFRPNDSHRSNRPPAPKPKPKVDHAPPPPIPSSMEIKGKAWVIDGDTIAIDRVKIRLAGIDAPELDQPWGQKSKWEMVRLCKGQIITVALTGETSYDRLVGTCYLSDGRDLGAEIIKAGLALDGWQFSEGKYRHLEDPEMRRKLRGYGRWR